MGDGSQQQEMTFTETTVKHHVRESNLPEGVKEYLMRKLFDESLRPVPCTGVVVQFPKQEQSSVSLIPIKKPKQGSHLDSLQAERFLLQWGGDIWGRHIPTRTFNSVLRVTRSLPSLTAMAFLELTQEEVLKHKGAGRKTWLYVKEIQENMKV